LTQYECEVEIELLAVVQADQEGGYGAIGVLYKLDGRVVASGGGIAVGGEAGRWVGIRRKAE
jgi:hypothetical protein